MRRLRAVLQSDLLVWRWVFLALYVVVVGTALGVLGAGDAGEFGLALVGSMIAAQCLFVFGAGTMSLSRPMRKRRLIWPALVGGLMAGLLVFGLLCAMFELAEVEDWGNTAQVNDWGDVAEVAGLVAVYGLPLLTWIGWCVLFFQRYRYRPRASVLWTMSKWLLAGSLLELMACVPAHLVVSRRPGCLVGLMTMIGIVAGITVMLFAFGPGLVLLFLRPRYRQELAAAKVSGERFCAGCGYDLRASEGRCPECGMMF